MSIPPLVCSTPPPPDQCEDEKDPEEFDLHYLSQEDYDENYDYGNFSTYNHFQSTDVSVSPKVKEKSVDIPQKLDTSIGIEELNATAPDVDTIKVVNNIEEDVNIEDLNLKLDEEPPVESENTETKTTNVQHVMESSKHKIEGDSPNIEVEEQEHNDLEPVPVDEFIEPTCINLSLKEESTETNIDSEDDHTNCVSESNIIPESESNIASANSLHASPNIVVKHDNESDLCPDDVDFTDFDDFQFASSTHSNSASMVQSCDNPWDSKQEDSGNFDDFKANFEGSCNNWQTSVDPDVEYSKEDIKNEVYLEDNDDDDFGEFDDFKSSAQVVNQSEIKEELTEQQVPVLNLTSPENEKQFLENINKVLSSMFEYEIIEPESKFEGKLESMLGETWGHILETDTRQPYMVNWNNSLAQKTLLKSLRIDSRNILFGPKWSYNMPKYAANLSTAPLQPVKQSAQPTTESDPVTTPPAAERSEAKSTATWSDPFTSDGHGESCNTEPRNTCSANPVIETGPTDLDVFEGSLSKPDKIYSSTMNVQPIRQINLPDTHIFTPTDSETPRSKTIHYDNTPAILLPHPTKEEKKQADLSSQPSASSDTSKIDDDYWDFQDYKGTSISLKSTTIEPNKPVKEEATLAPNSTTHGTQVLQPIKVEPTIPTLNWPDPGEIKETFDDFSDFISSSTWNTEVRPQTGEVSKPAVESKTVMTDKAQPVINPDVTTGVSSNSFDDEFDTFQSAMPTMIEQVPNHVEEVSSKPDLPMAMQNIPEVNVFDKFKNDSLSFNNASSSKMGGVSTTIHNKAEVINNSSSKNDQRPSPSTSLDVNMLQPIPAGSSTIQNQQKSGQILQPLSLENYYSQINWPSPGIDLQDLSRFNPVETLNSLKTDLSTNSHSKVASPAHSQKSASNSQSVDDDWGDFVSSKPTPATKKSAAYADDDEWTDFVSSPAVKPHNGLNTISLNVHTNLNIKKSNQSKLGLRVNHMPMDIPSLNYITPKTNTQKTYNDRHFQNL